eukprot:COSAG02_NODE_5054_length_4687_cov_7.076504_2_plen_545_part_00
MEEAVNDTMERVCAEFNNRPEVATFRLPSEPVRADIADVRKRYDTLCSEDKRREHERALIDCGMDEEYCRHMLEAHCDYEYSRRQQENAKRDLLHTDVERFPLFRWTAAKKPGLMHGYEQDTQTNIKNIQSQIKKIAEHMGAETKPPYHFLSQPETVANAITELYDDGSWSKVWTSLFKFLEVIGHSEKATYWRLFAEEKVHRWIPAKVVQSLTTDEVRKIRKEILGYADTVYEFLSDEGSDNWCSPPIGIANAVSPWGVVQSFLHGLFQFGQDNRWVPARCDPATLLYQDANLDCLQENYIDSKSLTECTIHYTYMFKVNPRAAGVKKNVDIDVGRHCPELAKLLFLLKPKAKPAALSQGRRSYGPFFMYFREKQFGKQCSGQDYSKRGERMINCFLSHLDNATKAKLLNNTSARYCSIMEDEFFTDEDVADRCRRRGQNPTKKSVAESHYGANMNNADNQTGRLSPGTMVRLIDLQKSSYLNDKQGLVTEYSVSKNRYRVVLLHDMSAGYFQMSNLQIESDQPSFDDLQQVSPTNADSTPNS